MEMQGSTFHHAKFSLLICWLLLCTLQVPTVSADSHSSPSLDGGDIFDLIERYEEIANDGTDLDAELKQIYRAHTVSRTLAPGVVNQVTYLENGQQLLAYKILGGKVQAIDDANDPTNMEELQASTGLMPIDDEDAEKFVLVSVRSGHGRGGAAQSAAVQKEFDRDQLIDFLGDMGIHGSFAKDDEDIISALKLLDFPQLRERFLQALNNFKDLYVSMGGDSTVLDADIKLAQDCNCGKAAAAPAEAFDDLRQLIGWMEGFLDFYGSLKDKDKDKAEIEEQVKKTAGLFSKFIDELGNSGAVTSVTGSAAVSTASINSSPRSSASKSTVSTLSSSASTNSSASTLSLSAVSSSGTTSATSSGRTFSSGATAGSTTATVAAATTSSSSSSSSSPTAPVVPPSVASATAPGPVSTPSTTPNVSPSQINAAGPGAYPMAPPLRSQVNPPDNGMGMMMMMMMMNRPMTAQMGPSFFDYLIFSSVYSGMGMGGFPLIL